MASTGRGGGCKAGFGWIFELLGGLEEAWHTNILRCWSLIIRKRQCWELPSSLRSRQRSERWMGFVVSHISKSSVGHPINLRGSDLEHPPNPDCQGLCYPRCPNARHLGHPSSVVVLTSPGTWATRGSEIGKTRMFGFVNFQVPEAEPGNPSGHLLAVITISSEARREK
jgi:hypothetical protein